MDVIVWEYQVKVDRANEFERIYDPRGAWAQLFQKQAGYLGTELLHDSNHPQRYITIDRWASSEAYNSFQLNWQAEYKVLDVRCESLTDYEACLGTFSLVQPGG